MTNQRKPTETAKIFWDRFGISAVECPKCQTYIPNVNVGPVECPICQYKFKVIE